MTFFDYLQLLGGFVLALGYIPQIIQIITTHSCRDLNLRTYLAMVLGIGLMEVYAINLVLNESGLMFLITNSVSLLLVIFICLLIIAMRKVKTGAEEKEALYVSKWDDGSVIVTPCKVNSRTTAIEDRGRVGAVSQAQAFTLRGYERRSHLERRLYGYQSAV